MRNGYLQSLGQYQKYLVSILIPLIMVNSIRTIKNYTFIFA